jgi:hypothetical protein
MRENDANDEKSLSELAGDTQCSVLETLRSLSKMQFDDANRRRPSDCLEGLVLSDTNSYIERTELVNKIQEAAESFGGILIRSPPSSGKTSLGQLLYCFYYKQENVLPISITCLYWIENCTFEEAFATKSGTNHSLAELLAKLPLSNKIVLIIDEAQLLYNIIPTTVWAMLKMGLPHQLRIMFLSAYGLSTPFEFSQDRLFGLSDLLFTEVEFNQYIEKVNATWVPISQFPVVVRMIYDATTGHPGLIRKILTLLYDFIRKNSQKGTLEMEYWTEGKLKQILVSGALADAVKNNSRAFCVENVKTLNLPVGFENNFLCGTVEEIHYDARIHNDLIKLGIFVVKPSDRSMDESIIDFSAPLIRRAFLSDFYEIPSEYVAYSIPSNLKDFVLDCLRQIPRSHLRNSNATNFSQSKLNEAKFKLEFAMAARRLLGGRAKLDPEVGHIFNTDTAVDFYIIGNYRWAIEFLIDGDRLNRHIKRFQPSGSYAAFPMNDHIIVDFKCSSGDDTASTVQRLSKHAPKSNLMTVRYTIAFHEFVVQYKTDDPITITLV